MALKDSDILELPEAPDFISKPPKYSLTEMIQICEKMLPHWNAIRYSRPDPKWIGDEFRLDDREEGGRKS